MFEKESKLKLLSCLGERKNHTIYCKTLTNKRKHLQQTDFIQKLILQKKSVRLQAVHQRVQEVRQVNQKALCAKTMFQNK